MKATLLEGNGIGTSLFSCCGDEGPSSKLGLYFGDEPRDNECLIAPTPPPPTTLPPCCG